MANNKTIKILVSVILTLIMIVTLTATTVLAADTVTTKLSKTRYVKSGSTYVEKGAYALNTGSDHPIYQIVSVDGTNITGTNYYCLNATAGNTWVNNIIGTEVTYNKSYDLVNDNDKSAISGLSATTYSDVVNNADFNKIMWLLDNMYVPGGTSVDDLLAQAGIVSYIDNGEKTYYYNIENRATGTSTNFFLDKDTVGGTSPRIALYGNQYAEAGGYRYFDEDDNQVNVVLTPEMIEIVQQAVLWYFTNGGSEYNCYTTSTDTSPRDWIKYAEDPRATDINWKGLTNIGSDDDTGPLQSTHIGAMLQEQADILYNYLVDQANAHSTYISTSTGTLSLTKGSSDITINESGDNYIVGPLKITTTGTVTGLSITTTPAGGTVTNASGTAKTLNANEDFYVTIPKSSVTESIKVAASATTTATLKKLWIGNITDTNTNAEQPIVEVEKKTTPLEDDLTVSLTKQFDLALRKAIFAINGSQTNIYNENGFTDAYRAVRTVNPNPSTIATEGTATYTHRKDPVVVKTGDKVTYRIYIYNEGEIDGYASKIIDTLASGLVKSSTMAAEVTSHKGNKYDVTTEGNKVILTIKGTPTSISAYSTTLDYDYVDIICEVNQTAATDGTTKHYLSNIAYIAEAKDKDGNIISRDRNNTESTPNNTDVANGSNGLNVTNKDNIYKGTSSKNIFNNTNNNTDYFTGQEDDDDFETVVILPKAFDLKLMKFISAINDEPTTRTITIDSSKLKAGTATTADYDVSKVPLKVKTGDIVTYTLRVYNEGEVDGYASEISEDIPAGLEFDATLNPDWTLSADGKTITTDVLSRANGTSNLLAAFDSENDNGRGSGLSYKDVTIKLKVTSTDTTNIIRNEAAITEDTDSEGNPVKDRDSDTEEWKKENSDDNYENNPSYPKYKEDDEDYDNIQLATFDLALRKFISKISTNGDFSDTSTTTTYNRAPQVDTSKLANGTATTATYNHSKEPILLNEGDWVLYTIRVYNEGDFDAYASEITDYLPEYLDYVTGTTTEAINSANWNENGKVITTKSTAPNTTTLLKAFDATRADSAYDATTNTAGSDHGLSYMDVQIICQVNNNAQANQVITNIAEVTEYKDEDGNEVEKDRDSEPANFPDSKKNNDYNGNGKDGDYVKGQQDDDDFEKVKVKEKVVDLALTKFITAVSKDSNIEDGEYLTPNKNIGSRTNEYTRATVADTTGLKAGTSHNATYTERKDIEPLVVGKNSYILYNIRVYNEGEVDVYAGEITDYLPENLEFVEGEFNTQYGWTANGQTVKTTYLSSSNGKDKILKAFDKANDDGKGSGLDYKDLPVLCKVSDKAESGKKLVNTAEITKYEDKDGKEIPKDIDSTPENKTEKNVEKRDEDDDDYEVVIIKDFDLALRKFITDINGTAVTSRIPKLSYENGKITYTHPKDVVKVHVGDTVTYTLRVFNEGDIAGYAEKISDDIPEYLEYLPENETNKEYKWVMYDKDGKETSKVSDAVKIVTDYASRANGAEKNLLKAFDKTAEISDTNPAHIDVKVAFKVKDPNSNKTVITNKAQISEDADEDGNPVDDIDSIPDKWNDGEDDQDYENVSVEYFDLSLLKYVTKTIVTENGKTKTTKTGNTGAKTDIIPKVEIYRKNLNKTVVKFEFTIKVTNEGDIAGYAKELTDYVPKGLKFYASDNKGWKDEGNNVISTTLLKDTLLQPGQSATVKVILRWINGEKNLGLKTNIAEISEDDNDEDVPDRDSTPDNKKTGEDDIDDAPVLLTISTGILENPIPYVTGALVVLTILGLGVVAIKRYVL